MPISALCSPFPLRIAYVIHMYDTWYYLVHALQVVPGTSTWTWYNRTPVCHNVIMHTTISRGLPTAKAEINALRLVQYSVLGVVCSTGLQCKITDFSVPKKWYSSAHCFPTYRYTYSIVYTLHITVLTEREIRLGFTNLTSARTNQDYRIVLNK
jgi:hypothetical protein